MVDSNQSQANILVWSVGIFIALSFSSTHILCLSVRLSRILPCVEGQSGSRGSKTMTRRVTGRTEWSKCERDSKSTMHCEGEGLGLNSDDLVLQKVIVIRGLVSLGDKI